MKIYDPDIQAGKPRPNRRSIRLRGYDYSQEGLYFITICVQNRECLFGEIVVGAGFARPDEIARPEMQLNEYGNIVENEWKNLQIKYPNIDLHEYIVMPNHIHGILQIVTPFVAAVTMGDTIGGQTPPLRCADKNVRPYIPTLGNVIAYFKYQTTKQIDLPTKLWQRNYHEHIIRNENSYQTISEYIINNPAKWNADRFYPKNNNEIK